MTTIHSNGSKWAGQEPDTIERLLETLAEHPLDCARFKRFQYPVPGRPGTVRFWGNFKHVSHVFNIDTGEPLVIQSLSLAIRQNLSRQGKAKG